MSASSSFHGISSGTEASARGLVRDGNVLEGRMKRERETATVFAREVTGIKYSVHIRESVMPA